MKIPQRGEIWITSLDPTKGSEIKKTRPCLVLSRSEYNRAASTVTLIPLSSGEVLYPPWQVSIGKETGVSKKCYLVLPQIRVAAKERLQKCVGHISPSRWPEIYEKLFFYLGFDSFFSLN